MTFSPNSFTPHPDPVPVPRLRPAREADLPAINDIYNYYVLHSTATYQTDPETPADRLAWFRRHGEAHPIIVAEDTATAPSPVPAAIEIVGWGSLSPYHPRAAYGRTVEDSVYVRHDRHRRGIGSALLTDLLARAAALGHHAVIAGIDAEQAASVALHRRLGFQPAGHLKEVGHKFGRWLDVYYLQRTLA